MTQKHLIYPEKVRRVPKQFSWVDHRLVRDHLIEQCSHQALALYLFLVTVGDQQGLSYYSDRSIGARLTMDSAVLLRSRNKLIRTKLIAYRKPLYQVLSLEPLKVARTDLDEPLAINSMIILFLVFIVLKIISSMVSLSMIFHWMHVARRNIF